MLGAKPRSNLRQAVRWATAVCAGAVLTACATTPPPSPTVVYRDVLKEVPRPCPATRPARPAPLARPLPTDLGALAGVLLAKLAEWAGPGKYGDQADAAIAVCTAP